MMQLITAPNPSPLTGPGTNSFVIGAGNGGRAVIDPGPAIDSHLRALAATGPISHILVTHSHLDHSEGARTLAEMTGAAIWAFGDSQAGRSPVMHGLGATVGGGEGIDTNFAPDHILRDGDAVTGEGWRLTAIHTPGHMGNHLSFLWGDQLFCGDIVLGWSSTLISPPDGDLSDYFRALARIEALAPARLLPAHGDPIEAPAHRIAELRAHRRQRSAQILAALRDGPATALDLAQRIYDVPPALLPAAERNVLAHLIALSDLGALSASPAIGAKAQFSIPA